MWGKDKKGDMNQSGRGENCNPKCDKDCNTCAHAKTNFMEGKTIQDWLGIHKSEEWMVKSHDTSDALLKDIQEVMVKLMLEFIQKEYPKAMGGFIQDKQTVLATHNFGRFMFSLGYAKGVAVVEDRTEIQGLDGIWGKE